MYTSLAKKPNEWSRATTFRNILQKLDPQQVQGSTWDPDSIMEYEFEAGLIDVPDKYDSNGLVPPGTLSATDKTWAQTWYPGTAAAPAELEVFQAVAIDLAAGQQVDFVFKPAGSRKYTRSPRRAPRTRCSVSSRMWRESHAISPRTTTAARTATRASTTSC